MVQHNSMLHLRVCSKTGLFSPYDDFLFTGRQRAFTEKLKGMKISIVRGTSSETRAFQRAGFYLNIKRKESSPPPLHFYSVCHREIEAASQH